VAALFADPATGVHVMKPAKKVMESGTMAEWDAEDRVVEYIGERACRASIAANAAKRLLQQWKLERDQMTPARPVYDLFNPEFQDILAELDGIASRSPSDPASEQYVIELIEHLPPDAAAHVAIWVAVEQGRKTAPRNSDTDRNPDRNFECS